MSERNRNVTDGQKKPKKIRKLLRWRNEKVWTPRPHSLGAGQSPFTIIRGPIRIVPCWGQGTPQPTVVRLPSTSRLKAGNQIQHLEIFGPIPSAMNGNKGPPAT